MNTTANPDRSLFVTAHEIGEVMGISSAYAYRIIRQLNDELSNQGYLTIQGKTSKKYFYERIYGKEST